jgi:hypothetical protein
MYYSRSRHGSNTWAWLGLALAGLHAVRVGLDCTRFPGRLYYEINTGPMVLWSIARVLSNG